MKKNIIYIGIAVLIGLMGGYVWFGNSFSTSNKELSDPHNHSEVSGNQIWTCSMHPQIRQTEAGDCPICGMDLILKTNTETGIPIN
jgi:Cu(I)/Ag(I) efflux system membrane fusion protein